MDDGRWLMERMVVICERLELDPVLRYFVQHRLFTHEMCEEIQNPNKNPTEAQRAVAFVEHLNSGPPGQAKAFVEALRATGQTELAEILDPSTKTLADEAEVTEEAGTTLDKGAHGGHWGDIKLERHLEEICARLDLEPVLRRLRQKGKLSKQACQEIRNQNVYKTQDDRAEALVDRMYGKESAFMEALRNTRQTELAEMITTASEQDSGDESPNETFAGDAGDDKTKSSAKSLRSVGCQLKWPCQSPDCGDVLFYHKLHWCFNCKVFICGKCDGLVHYHGSGSATIPSKFALQAAYDRVKERENKNKKKLTRASKRFVTDLAKQLNDKLAKRIKAAPTMTGALEDALLLDKSSPAYTSAGELLKGKSSSQMETIASTALALSMREPAVVLPAQGSSLVPSQEPEALGALAADLLDRATAPATSIPSQGVDMTTKAPEMEDFIPEAYIAGFQEDSRGIFIVGGTGHKRTVTRWRPDLSGDEEWRRRDQVLRWPRWDHACTLTKAGTILNLGGMTGPGPRGFWSCEMVQRPSYDRSGPFPGLPQLLTGAKAALIGDQVFLFGGRLWDTESGAFARESTATCRRFSSAEESAWPEGAAMLKPRADFALAVGGSQAWAIGGDFGALGATEECEVFDAGSGSWLLAAPLPQPLVGCEALRLADGRILVVGGRSSPDCSTVTSSCFAIDDREGKWGQVGSMKQRRAFHGLAGWGEEALAVGGRGGESGEELLLDAEQWESRMDEWRLHDTRLEKPCHRAGVVTVQ